MTTKPQNQKIDSFPEKRTEFAAVYASLAVALSRLHGFNMDQIREAIHGSQTLLKDYDANPCDLLKLCEEETGCIIVERHYA